MATIDWPFDGDGEAPRAGANVAEYSVSELSFALKKTVEDTYGYVRVRGELGRVSRPASGHVYLDLKDDRAVLGGVIWKGAAAKLKIRPEQGLEVVVTGRLTTYPGQSKYQIVIDTMEPAGVGALMALLEERRKKLAAEGLFDAAAKRPLPYLPRVIGVVTSPTGAVIRDILHRLADRFPSRVVVWPVRVQGDTCASEVAAAIRGFEAAAPDGPVPRPDLIIVARGGGSLEDLWGFNEEEVVRAVAACSIPLIAAVGHETDWTLIDHAADERCPTPTAAAERAVPVRAELVACVEDYQARLGRALWRLLEERKGALRAARRGLPSGERILALPLQSLDACAHRLDHALRASTAVHRGKLERISGRLSAGLLRQKSQTLRAAAAHAAHKLEGGLRANTAVRRRDFERVAVRVSAPALRDRIASCSLSVANFAVRAERAYARCVETLAARLDTQAKLLVSYSYHGVLDRGFALVRSASGEPLRSAAAAAPGMQVAIEFCDGRRGATIDGEAPQRPKRKAGASSADPEAQGSLL